jgi:hypothetical protein
LDDYERMRCHVTERKYIVQLALSAILISPNFESRRFHKFVASHVYRCFNEHWSSLLWTLFPKLSVGTIKTGERMLWCACAYTPGPLPLRARVFLWNYLRNSKFISRLRLRWVNLFLSTARESALSAVNTRTRSLLYLSPHPILLIQL